MRLDSRSQRLLKDSGEIAPIPAAATARCARNRAVNKAASRSVRAFARQARRNGAFFWSPICATRNSQVVRRALDVFLLETQNQPITRFYCASFSVGVVDAQLYRGNLRGASSA
jgi:hypothetical protein